MGVIYYIFAIPINGPPFLFLLYPFKKKINFFFPLKILAPKLYKNGDWGLGPEMGILEKLRGWCII